MKEYLLFSSVFLITSCTPKYSAQRSADKITKYHESIECNLSNKYSVTELRSMFPFNRAKKVLMIAFSSPNLFGESIRTISEVKDTITDDNRNSYVLPQIKNRNDCSDKGVIKKWDYSDVSSSKILKILPNYCTKESITLNYQQIDTLSDILFNFELSKKTYITWHASCYTPRNAVLFLDEKEKIIAVVEVCFECYQLKKTFGDEDDKFDDFCGERKAALKSLFSKMGIKYGLEIRK